MSITAEQSLARFLESPTRFLFFTGPGGVGKTSLACASAVALADGGRRVLLVSTDPASTLDEVLGVRLTSAPTDIPNVPGLAASNTDPAAAAAAYHEKLPGLYRGKLPAAIVRSMDEPLSGACTREIAAFDAFSKLLGEPTALQDDLRRAQIEPFTWVINRSFAESGPRDPLLLARGRGEVQFIREVGEKHSKRTALVPWVMEAPTGSARRQQLFQIATTN